MSDRKNENIKQNHQDGLTPWQKENILYLKSKENKNDEKTVEKENFSDVVSNDALENKEDVNELPEKQTQYSFADRLPKVREERKKTLTRRLSLIIGVLSLLTIIMIYYISPYSKLEKIEVTGNNLVSEEDVLRTTDFELNKNIWVQYFDKKQLLKNVKLRNPRIKTTAVSIIFPNTFKISLTEYPTVAYALNEGHYHPVLEDGHILNQIVQTENETLPIIKNFKSESQTLKDVLELYKKVPENIKSNISDIESKASAENPNRVELTMKDGNKIVGLTNNLAQKIELYPDFIAKIDGQGVINMEAGVYFDPYEKTDKTEADENSTS